MTPWFHRGGLYSGGPEPGLLRRRRGGRAARVRPGDRARLGPGARAHLPDRRADQPRDADRRAAGAPARPVARCSGIVTMGAPLDREACLRYQELLTAADLQRLRHDRGVLEHVPAPGGPARRTPARPAAPAPTTTSPSCAIYEDRAADPDDLVAKDGDGGRRGHRALGEVRLRLRQPARGAGGALPRRLALHRRPRHLGRRRVRDDRRPQGRHDHLRRRERASRRRSRRVLNEHPGVADSAVVGVPGRALGRARRRLRGRARDPAARRRRARRATATSTRCSPTTSAPAPTASSTSCR